MVCFRGQILENLRNIDGIVVDESFIDFTGDRQNHTVQPLINEFSNLVVLRSLSKEFVIPGLRLGYVVTSNKKIRKKMEQGLSIWNINSIGERFIELFPRYQKEYEESIRQVIQDRNKFITSLHDIDMLKIIDGKANFIFCKILNENINSTLSKVLFS